MKVIRFSLCMLVLVVVGCGQRTELPKNNYYQQIASEDPLLNHVVQDIDTGAIYRVGIPGDVISQLQTSAGKLRGFDLKDSILAWCTDSLAITVLNRNTNKTRVINFEGLKIHHDLVVHYPFMTALYKSDKMKDYKGYPVFDDGIVKVDLRNSEIKTWSVQDVLTDNVLPDSLPDGKKRLNTHSNSVEVDAEGNYYISFRDISQVWKVSSDLSTLIYRVGVSSPFSLADGQDFVGQHSVDIIQPDEFFLFDNGSTGRDKAVKSRIVRVSVNPASKTFRVKNILSLPDSLSTARMGSVQALGDRLSVSMYNFGFHILELDTTGKVRNHLFRTKANAIKVLPELAEE